MNVDILYWIFGVAMLSLTINLVLETLEKGNFKMAVNLAAMALILLRLIPLIQNLFEATTVFMRW